MSESKLKALKVVDLKDILTRAQVSVQGKANKSDLIARILASPDALQVYHQLHGSPAQKDAVQKQPEQQSPSQPPVSETITTESQSESSPAPQPDPVVIPTDIPVAAQPPKSNTPAAPPPSSAPAAQAPLSEEEELAKRKARAERFNIPLVDPSKLLKSQLPKSPKVAAKQATKPATKTAPQLPDDPEKLAARAKRFGITTPPEASAQPTNGRGNKRPAPIVEPADAAEEERRRKRGERFKASPDAVQA